MRRYIEEVALFGGTARASGHECKMLVDERRPIGERSKNRVSRRPTDDALDISVDLDLVAVLMALAAVAIGDWRDHPDRRFKLPTLPIVQPMLKLDKTVDRP